MTITVKVEGLKELDRALMQLPKATGKNVLRRVGRKALQPLADDMRAKAPDREGSSEDRDLRESIGVSSKLSKRQAAQHRKMFRNDRDAVELFAGAGALPHPHLQEFGTQHHAPQPFARPAWDGNKNRVLETIKRDLAAEIKKSADRLARKRARAARG